MFFHANIEDSSFFIRLMFVGIKREAHNKVNKHLLSFIYQKKKKNTYCHSAIQIFTHT